MLSQYFRYYISFDGGTVYSEMYLSAFPKLEYEKESGEVFYRLKAKKDWLIDKSKNSTIYATLLQYFYDREQFDTEIKVRIDDNSGISSNEMPWYGYFNVVEMKVFNDGGYVAVKPHPDDSYRPILDNYEIEIDIIESGLTEYSPIVVYRSGTEYDFMEKTGGGEEPPSPWTSWNGGTISNVYFIFCEIIYYGIGIQYMDDFYNEYSLDQSKNYFMFKSQVLYMTPPDTTGWVQDGKLWRKPSCTAQDITYTLTHFRRLSAVTQYILDELDDDYDIGAFTYVSQLFLNTDSGTHNEITGDSPNRLPNLLIAQKSDVKDPDATNPATVGLISFKELMGIYKNVWDAWWYLDSWGDFRIEHRKYFDGGKSYTGSAAVGCDLTNSDRYNQDLFRQIQNFTLDIPVNYETWSMMEGDPEHDDYKEMWRTISYSIGLGGRKEERHDLPKLTTDISAIINDPENIADEGFVIVDVNAGDQIVNYDVPRYSNRPNGHMYPQAFIDEYHRYGRYLLTGKLLGDITTFSSERKTRTQGPVTFLRNEIDGFDPYKLITTRFITHQDVLTSQSGEVKSALWDLADDSFQVVILYENNITEETYRIKSNDTDLIEINGSSDNLLWKG